MEEPTSNNVINNYKGVMLCSRPNEAQGPTVEKPFCARVVPKDQIGLVPTKDITSIQYQRPKHKLEILDRHKKWLDKFKKNVHTRKQQLEEAKRQEEEKHQRIKEQAEADRQRSKKMRDEYNQTANNVLNILDDKKSSGSSVELNAANLQALNKSNQPESPERNPKPFKKKKKANQKPLWAQTQQQIEQNQEEQVDELIGFFQSNHVEDYAEDSQVQEILRNLKNKIHLLKEDEEWKQKQLNKISHRKRDKNYANEEAEDDMRSNYSVQSNTMSVASEKSQKHIEELKRKKQQQQEWDNISHSQKSNASNLDEKIAKNIADEVLRNYPNMRGVHSNVSIRKLLEQEAAKVINEPITRPVITTIVKEKNKVDANNLPYLHRNPAI